MAETQDHEQQNQAVKDEASQEFQDIFDTEKNLDAVPESVGKGYSMEVAVLHNALEYLKDENTSLKVTIKNQNNEMTVVRREYQEQIERFLKKLDELQNSYNGKLDEFIGANEKKLDEIHHYIKFNNECILEEATSLKAYISNIDKGLRKMIESGIINIDKEIKEMGTSVAELRELSDEKFAEVIKRVKWGFGEHRVEEVLAFSIGAKERLYDILNIVKKSEEALQRIDPNNKRIPTNTLMNKYDENHPDYDPEAVPSITGEFGRAGRF